MNELPDTNTKGPTYAPVECLMLFLTEDCNLRCTYCFVDKKSRRMSSETARKAVDFFLHRDVSGLERRLFITFFGGEPFLELDRMEEVIAYAREYRSGYSKRIEFNATTNGTVCSDRVERIIRDAEINLLVSLDGDRHASRHRPMLSSRESYDRVARNIRKFAAWSPEMNVRMTFHPEALDLLGNVQHALDLGAPSIALCPVVEANWSGHEERLDQAYQELSDWYIASARRGYIPPLYVTNDMLRQLHLVRSGGQRPARPCGVGTSLLGIDPDGNVMPCHRFLYRPGDWLGTVDKPRMSDERWKYVHLSSRDILGCDTCIAEPVCGGGCRIVALIGGYGLDQAHPSFCLLSRAHTRMVLRIYETLLVENNEHFHRTLMSSVTVNPAMTELATR